MSHTNSSIVRILIGLIAASVAVPAAAQEPPPVLPIPPLLEFDREGGRLAATLVAAAGEHEFYPGLPSPSVGYNGSYLGPTIVLTRGESYSIRVVNQLDELTTLHWHGLDVQAAADGGPRQPIEPGQQWDAVFDITQAAATAWYHPHAIGTTASQVAMGMAGMIIIQDDTTPAARTVGEALPHEYGVDDLPVIFQDRRLDSAGRNSYRPSRPDVMRGYSGNTIVTNGVVSPVATVPRGLVRLRLLNGSNSAYIQAQFPSVLQAHVIGADGGSLAEPIAGDRLTVAAAERYEVIVNTADLEAGETVWIDAVTDTRLTGRILGLRVDSGASAVSSGSARLPVDLNPPPVLVDPSTDIDALPRRRFVLETNGMMSRTPFTINGRAMDIDRIDEAVPLGRLEIWEIVNAGPMNVTHSFHVHSAAFQVVRFNGGPPPDIIAGRKDTVIVPPGVTVEIAVRFDRYPGVFMYHCHMLEHEEAGLMGQFEVVQ